MLLVLAGVAITAGVVHVVRRIGRAESAANVRRWREWERHIEDTLR